MDQNSLIREIHSQLHVSTVLLTNWLKERLPRIATDWWHDCVISNLSISQREYAHENGYKSLEEFDLITLLRIADKSWYDLSAIAYLTQSDRETFRTMRGVRNRWSHCSAELPGKDAVIADLNTLVSFLALVGGEKSNRDKLERMISEVEKPGSLRVYANETTKAVSPFPAQGTADGQELLAVNSMIYLLTQPEKKGVIISAEMLGGKQRYQVFLDNELRTLYRNQIEPVPQEKTPSNIDAETFRSFLTAYQIQHPSSQSLYSLNAARIDFVPYQFRPALKLIQADEPRILIADSVGVGKTIEAGLIMKELEARGGAERVLILCPKPLVAERKWEQEMKRFDEDFIALDSAGLRRVLSDSERDGRWPLRYQKAIIPYSILDSRAWDGIEGNYPGLSELSFVPHFDLVILDEAHHLRNGSVEKAGYYSYKCAKFFCDHADAVVMLTATPLQTDNRDLYTLLNLLRPDLIADEKTFEVMSRPNEYITRAARIIRAGEEDWHIRALECLRSVRKTQWGDNVIAESPRYHDVLSRLETGESSREERIHLMSDVESLGSFYGMINRTRRRDIQNFCIRRTTTVEVQFTQAQRGLYESILRFEHSALARLYNERSIPFMMSTLRRQASSCVFALATHIHALVDRRLDQLDTIPEEEADTIPLSDASIQILRSLAKEVLQLASDLPEEDPKFEKTLEVIEKKQRFENNKIMIFSSFRHTLTYLKKRLREYGYRVEQIDGSVRDEDRYQLKQRFELPKDNSEAVDILLFTEVGSEGLDYQFCDMMINYDLPWNPMRIEQRIGRIDRRGQQSKAVNICNIITADTVDADIYFRCLMRIGLFEKSIGDCEEILGQISAQIDRIAVDTTLTEEERRCQLEQIADNEVRRIQELEQLEEKEKDLFGLDLSEFTITREIQKAENPWLMPSGVMHMIEHYFRRRLGVENAFFGTGALKTLRLPVSARQRLKEDLERIPGSPNAQRSEWKAYLNGNQAKCSVTFDSETAKEHRDCIFITPMHPLSRQAAAWFEQELPVHVCLACPSERFAEGDYPFSVYAWQYMGAHPHTALKCICADECMAGEFPEMLLEAVSATDCTVQEWKSLDELEANLWDRERRSYLERAGAETTYRLESTNSRYRTREYALEQRIADAPVESQRKIYEGQLRNVREAHQLSIEKIRKNAGRSDIYTTILANGVMRIEKEDAR